MSVNWAITPQNICCAKAEGIINHSTVTKCFKQFHLGCKYLDQANSGRSKTGFC